MPKSITKEQFDIEVTQSEKPVILEVFSQTCGTCQQMEPIIAELEKEHGGKYKFVLVDVEKARDLALDLDVRTVPTFLFMKEGKEKGREQGYIPKDEFVEKITMYFEKD